MFWQTSNCGIAITDSYLPQHEVEIWIYRNIVFLQKREIWGTKKERGVSDKTVPALSQAKLRRDIVAGPSAHSGQACDVSYPPKG